MTETANKKKRLEAIQKEVERIGAEPSSADTQAKIRLLEEQLRDLQSGLASSPPGAWYRVMLARHAQRPHFLDFVALLFQDFSEIHGDRAFGEDPALVAGFARFRERPVLVLGHQKGRDTTQKLHRNFGMPKPEGYRKALRAMKLAAKFQLPIFAFVDTPGAYPGIGSEERGQAEAIARNLLEMARLPVPIVVTVTGEGGSGGALAIAVGDRIMMLENSVYSVISPEGCASITWRDGAKAEVAAEALGITAQDLVKLGIVDSIVSEPPGGAHLDHAKAAELLEPALSSALDELSAVPIAQLIDARYDKFRRMGQFFQEAP